MKSKTVITIILAFSMMILPVVVCSQPETPEPPTFEPPKQHTPVVSPKISVPPELRLNKAKKDSKKAEPAEKGKTASPKSLHGQEK